jgi:hypothetical protein
LIYLQRVGKVDEVGRRRRSGRAASSMRRLKHVSVGAHELRLRRIIGEIDAAMVVIWKGKGAVGGNVNETRPRVEGENDTDNGREKKEKQAHSVKLTRVRSPLAAASARA